MNAAQETIRWARDRWPDDEQLIESGTVDETRDSLAHADKLIMRDESLPIEERRAAFRRHNRRQNPEVYGDA